MVLSLYSHMPITSSATKALRGSKRKTVFNLRLKNAVEKQVKDVRKLIKAGKRKEAEKLMPLVQQVLDKAVAKDFIKKNTASRLKSRAVAAIKKITK